MTCKSTLVTERNAAPHARMLAFHRTRSTALDRRLVRLQQGQCGVTKRRRHHQHLPRYGANQRLPAFLVGFSGDPVTSLGRSGALRAFMTATSFFQPALPLGQTATYPGLEEQPAQDLVVLRCIPPEREKVDAILATWPNVFAAVQRDLGSQGFTCPYTGDSADHEIYCIAKQFDDTPSGVVVTTLANVLATANTLFDPAHPELARWLKTYYGIYPPFSGLGFSVKDSYRLSSSNPTTSAEVLQKSVVPEYLLANVSLSDAGCRCIRVAPYEGRDQANLEPDFVWNKGGSRLLRARACVSPAVNRGLQACSERSRRATTNHKSPFALGLGRQISTQPTHFLYTCCIRTGSGRRLDRRPRGEAHPSHKENERMAPTASGEQASTLLTSFDLHLFNEGKHNRLYEKLGAHLTEIDGKQGTYFAVWAPDAERISVVGDFNGWNPDSHPMTPRGSSGVWEAFVPGLGKGSIYKYHIRSRFHMYEVNKADPYGFHHETPPRTGSIVWDLDYEWDDDDWMRTRHERNAFDAPMSIYEVHLGSWMRVPKRATARSAIANSRPGWPTTSTNWASPTSSSCPSWSIRSSARGATRSPATSRPAPLRHAAGFHVPGRLPAPARHRRHPRLGAVALSQRRARPGLLRRHAPLRARRSAQGLSSRLEVGHLQLRPQRGARLPDQQRHVLARPLPHRRPAHGRHRLHALPRLLAQAGRVDPQRVRRPREPGSRLAAAGA